MKKQLVYILLSVAFIFSLYTVYNMGKDKGKESGEKAAYTKIKQRTREQAIRRSNRSLDSSWNTYDQTTKDYVKKYLDSACAVCECITTPNGVRAQISPCRPLTK